MIVAESHRGRRLIGRLDRGADLLPALVEVAAAHKVRCGEVRAFGTLEEVDLREFDQRMRTFRAARRFTTPFSLVQLTGNLAERDGHAHLEASVTISRERDNGIELIGGHLQRARVYAVDFVIDCFDDILLRRSIDSGTGLPLFSHAFAAPAAAPAPTANYEEIATEENTAPTPPKPLAHGGGVVNFDAPASGHFASDEDRDATPPVSWSDVAAASAAVAPTVEPELTDETLRPGDVIEHPKFGRCEVERIEGDTEYAQVRLRNQRLVRLSLDVLQLVREGDEGSHRKFRAVMPR